MIFIILMTPGVLSVPPVSDMPDDERNRFLKNFAVGCLTVCEKFGVDWHPLDVDKVVDRFPIEEDC
jgi:hypothetical protein